MVIVLSPSTHAADYSNRTDDEASIIDQLPHKYPPKAIEFTLKDCNVNWRMLDGSDFEGTRGSHLMTVDLSKLTIKYRTFSNPVANAFPAQETIHYRVDFSIADLEITDLLPQSTYNRFLCYDQREFRIGRRPMIRVCLEGMLNEKKDMTISRETAK